MTSVLSLIRGYVRKDDTVVGLFQLVQGSHHSRGPSPCVRPSTDEWCRD